MLPPLWKSGILWESNGRSSDSGPPRSRSAKLSPNDRNCSKTANPGGQVQAILKLPTRRYNPAHGATVGRPARRHGAPTVSPTVGRLYRERLSGLPPHAVWRHGVSRTFQITATFLTLTSLENVRMALPSHRRLTYARLTRAAAGFDREAARALLT